MIDHDELLQSLNGCIATAHGNSSCANAAYIICTHTLLFHFLYVACCQYSNWECGPSTRASCACTSVPCRVYTSFCTRLQSYHKLSSHMSHVVHIPVRNHSAFLLRPPICTNSIFVVFSDSIYSHQCCLSIPLPIDIHTACFYAFCTCGTVQVVSMPVCHLVVVLVPAHSCTHL
jgi:hypothetical protein